MNYTPDLMLDMLQNRISLGMTKDEAVQDVGQPAFHAAAISAITQYGKKHPLFWFAVDVTVESRHDSYLQKALDLYAAGWTSETPHESQTEIMSWYWRRPPMGNRKTGRRFMSTDQAWNHMRKG